MNNKERYLYWDKKITTSKDKFSIEEWNKLCNIWNKVFPKGVQGV